MAACVTACVSACSSCCFGAFLLARCEDRHDAIMMRSPCEDDTEARDASVHAGGGREKKYKSCDDALCSCCHSLSCPTPPSVCAFVICRVSSTSVWRCLSSLSPAALLSIYQQILVRTRTHRERERQREKYTHTHTHTHTQAMDSGGLGGQGMFANAALLINNVAACGGVGAGQALVRSCRSCRSRVHSRVRGYGKARE